MVNTVHKMSIYALGKGIRVFWGLFCELCIFVFFVIAFDIGEVLHFELEIKNNNQHIIKTSSIVLLLQFYLFLHIVYCLFFLKL